MAECGSVEWDPLKVVKFGDYILWNSSQFLQNPLSQKFALCTIQLWNVWNDDEWKKTFANMKASKSVNEKNSKSH